MMSVRPSVRLSVCLKHFEINKKIYTDDVGNYVNALKRALNEEASSIRVDRASKIRFKFN